MKRFGVLIFKEKSISAPHVKEDLFDGGSWSGANNGTEGEMRLEYKSKLLICLNKSS